MAKEFDPSFELWVATYYQSKVQSCESRNIEFKLNLLSVRNLLASQTCAYTGMKLTRPRGNGKPLIATDVTIDRIDSSIGYVKGNVVAVSNVANNFKSIFENPCYNMEMLMAEKALNKIQKKIKQVKERQ